MSHVIFPALALHHLQGRMAYALYTAAQTTPQTCPQNPYARFATSKWLFFFMPWQRPGCALRDIFH